MLALSLDSNGLKHLHCGAKFEIWDAGAFVVLTSVWGHDSSVGGGSAMMSSGAT